MINKWTLDNISSAVLSSQCFSHQNWSEKCVKLNNSVCGYDFQFVKWCSEIKIFIIHHINIKKIEIVGKEEDWIVPTDLFPVQ